MTRCTSQLAALSTPKKKTPKNATVTITTQVVIKTSRRVGQVTWRISTRTSCRNPRHRCGCSARRPKKPSISSGEPRPSVSSVFNFPTCVAIVRRSLRPQPACCVYRLATSRCPRLPPSPAKLAGEEGFEPPLSVLETDGLPLNLLPFTLSGSDQLPRRVRPVHLPLGLPFVLLKTGNQVQFLFPPPALQLNFSLTAPEPERRLTFLHINDRRCTVACNKTRAHSPFRPAASLPFGPHSRASGQAVEPTPLTNSTYFTSLWPVCLRHALQNFFVSIRSECFFRFLVVV